MQVIKRPTGMSQEDFQKAIDRAADSNGTEYTVVFRDGEAMFFPTSGPTSVKTALDNLTSTAPKGVRAIAAIAELPEGAPAASVTSRPIHVVVGKGQVEDEALASVTHLLVIEFHDKKAYLLGGTLPSLMQFLSGFQKNKKDKTFWCYISQHRC